MTWEATVKFAPLMTIERINDPGWQDADRHMVTPQTFRLPHKKESIPLIADHDENCELGIIRDWWRLRWTDGEWLAATATLHAPPPPFLQRGARASYGYKPLFQRAAVIGGPEGQVISRAILTEVTVCAAQVPLEPLAEVISVQERKPEPVARQRAQARADEVIVPQPAPVRPSSERDELRRRIEWAERRTGRPADVEAIVLAMQRELHGPSLHDLAHRETESRPIGPSLVRPDIGKVLAVGGVSF